LSSKKQKGRAMLTKEFRQTYDGLPEEVRSVILALSILIDRIGSLPKPDRDDLFELLQEWRKASDPEEQQGLRSAMEEILAQIPANVKALDLTENKPLTPGRKKWAEHVGRKIKEMREAAKLTQMQLAEKAGLPQSHISRLENAEYSPTSLTIEKIAKALGVLASKFDPSAE
jgi:DNA-binding XRE family transcriptional regulator